eukprot:748498-Hanusia_phi.AAC.1
MLLLHASLACFPACSDSVQIHKFAKKSIDLMWRIGLVLLNKRIRKVVDVTFASKSDKKVRAGGGGDNVRWR